LFVDDIIFGGNDEASEKFIEDMKNEFEMSMIGEMKYFFGLKNNVEQGCYFNIIN
jgi:accessory colonization factor AcfC